MSEVSGIPVGLTTHVSTFRRSHAIASAAAPGKTGRIVTAAAHIVAMAAASPQERAAAAVPALRRGADNGQWCCCHDDVSDNERASGNGSIAVAGTQVASAPRVSRAVFLSHRSSLRRTAAGEGARSAVRRRGDVTSGGLGRYWAAQWHLARAVGKRFRGCRAKRLCVHPGL